VRGLKETTLLRDQFGNRVRGLRGQLGLTQEQLAERASISVDFLSLIERGKNSPSFENLDGLADALGVTVAQLFTFEGNSVETQ
jgi:transcriptional regulator with XRE-family HTH domain